VKITILQGVLLFFFCASRANAQLTFVDAPTGDVNIQEAKAEAEIPNVGSNPKVDDTTSQSSFTGSATQSASDLNGNATDATASLTSIITNFSISAAGSVNTACQSPTGDAFADSNDDVDLTFTVSGPAGYTLSFDSSNQNSDVFIFDATTSETVADLQQTTSTAMGTLTDGDVYRLQYHSEAFAGEGAPDSAAYASSYSFSLNDAPEPSISCLLISSAALVASGRFKVFIARRW
jgi:hypothetical protein